MAPGRWQQGRARDGSVAWYSKLCEVVKAQGRKGGVGARTVSPYIWLRLVHNFGLIQRNIATPCGLIHQ